MRLIYIFAAILAVSVAENSDKQLYEDLEAMETMELKKESQDLSPAASAYNRYIHQNYVPNQNYVPPQTWNPPQHDPIPVQPIHTHVPVPANPPYIPQSPPQNYVPTQTWTPPQHNPIPLQPVHTHVPGPANPPYVPPSPPAYIPPVTASPPSYVPPVQSDYIPPQNNYYHPQNTWTTPHYQYPTTSPPAAAVIKNEQYFGDNGSYKYEYQITDGTHVGEEGYFTDPKATDESLVKKGWYSYKGADGKTYTVTYWADHTGFHAYGDHLPTPPPHTG